MQAWVKQTVAGQAPGRAQANTPSNRLASKPIIESHRGHRTRNADFIATLTLTNAKPMNTLG